MDAVMTQLRDDRSHILDTAVFLVAGLCLLAPSGYGLGGAILWSLGLWRVVTRRGAKEFPMALSTARSPQERQGLWVIWSCFGYGLIQAFVHFYHGNGLRELDDTVPFLFAPLLWRALRGDYQRIDLLCRGIVVGAMGAGIIALWEVLVRGVDRAHGFTFVIQFGNIAIFLGIASLLGLLLLHDTASGGHRGGLALCLLGFALGATASILSGSRGGWVAALPGLLLVVWTLRGVPTVRRIGLKVAFLLVGLALILSFSSGMSVPSRIAAAFKDLNGLKENGHTQGALNERYALQKIAREIIPERLWLGHSRSEYIKKRDQIVDARGFSPAVKVTGSHVHNDFLQALVRGGLLSFIGLFAMYAIPLAVASRDLRAADLRLRYLSATAVLLVLMYGVFGMSQTFLHHNSGRMVFAIVLASLFTLRANIKDDRPITARPNPPLRV
jgi:O-antigen ligase